VAGGESCACVLYFCAPLIATEAHALTSVSLALENQHFGVDGGERCAFPDRVCARARSSCARCSASATAPRSTGCPAPTRRLRPCRSSSTSSCTGGYGRTSRRCRARVRAGVILRIGHGTCWMMYCIDVPGSRLCCFWLVCLVPASACVDPHLALSTHVTPRAAVRPLSRRRLWFFARGPLHRRRRGGRRAARTAARRCLELGRRVARDAGCDRAGGLGDGRRDGRGRDSDVRPRLR
jgi:hypothetical protein